MNGNADSLPESALRRPPSRARSPRVDVTAASRRHRHDLPIAPVPISDRPGDATVPPAKPQTAPPRNRSRRIGSGWVAAWAACLSLWLAAGAAPATSQGYAGLAADAEGFTFPSPDRVLTFPADHGPHPDFRIEWWYLTANLSGPDGTPYGVQWTLFRSALEPGDRAGWASPQIWMAHAAATTATSHHVAERFARGGIGQAGVTADPFEAWIDDWRLVSTGGGTDPLDSLTLTVRSDGFGYALDLAADGPLVLQGEAGFSVKSPEGQASHYYSQPHYTVMGTLTLPGTSDPIPVTGRAWLDREWSSQPLSETQDGWDWASLHLDTGARLMGYRLRHSDGTAFTPATWIAPDGTVTTYGPGALVMTPLATAEVNGADVPVAWQIELPDQAVSIRIDALNPQAWMATSFPYWEGPVTVTGSHSGEGYLEMTGYGPD